MKKIVAVICGLMVCLSVASAKKKSSGKFVLGLDDSFPPLGFRDKNNEIVESQEKNKPEEKNEYEENGGYLGGDLQ